MSTIVEGMLTFVFPDDWQVNQFGKYVFYSRRFQSACGGGAKEMDFLAIQPKACCWLIEVKDYRQHERTKPSELPAEVADKVFDTLAGMLACQWQASEDEEKNFARMSVRCPTVRVVLHLEQPTKPSRLHPRNINPADVLQKLKQLIKAIDPHPRVVEIEKMAGIPWTVS